MSDDDLAADHRMPAEPARQAHHAHAVIDAELQRLHPLALRSCLPASPSSFWRPDWSGRTSPPARDRCRRPNSPPPIAHHHCARRQFRLPGFASPDKARSCRDGNFMNERIEAWALNRLLAWALRPVAVPNGNRLGRFRPSGPIGIRARTMTPRLSRNACSPSIAGWAPYIMRNASPSSCSAPESSRGQYVMPAAISHCSNRQLLNSPSGE